MTIFGTPTVADKLSFIYSWFDAGWVLISDPGSNVYIDKAYGLKCNKVSLLRTDKNPLSSHYHVWSSHMLLQYIRTQIQVSILKFLMNSQYTSV